MTQYNDPYGISNAIIQILDAQNNALHNHAKASYINDMFAINDVTFATQERLDNIKAISGALGERDELDVLRIFEIELRKYLSTNIERLIDTKEPRLAIDTSAGDDSIDIKKINKVFDEFWKDIVIVDGGLIDMARIKAELYDYHHILNEVPKVYSHITDGLMSHQNYYAFDVIAVSDGRIQQIVDSEINDMTIEDFIESKKFTNIDQFAKLIRDVKESMRNHGIDVPDITLASYIESMRIDTPDKFAMMFREIMDIMIENDIPIDSAFDIKFENGFRVGVTETPFDEDKDMGETCMIVEANSGEKIIANVGEMIGLAYDMGIDSVKRISLTQMSREAYESLQNI